MEFKEFGEKSYPSVLLVGDPANSFAEKSLVSALLNDYHVIVPVMCGAEGSDERAADSVERYVWQRQSGRVFAICGTPMGWGLIQKILARRAIRSDKVIVGSQENALRNLIIPMLEDFALEGHICQKKQEGLH